MKLQYVADDGQVFDTQQECLNHENKSALVSAIQDLFDKAYYPKTVGAFIVNHIDEINKILNSPAVTTNKDGWISNVGHDSYQYPEHLDENTKVELKFRNGETEIGIAGDCDAGWIETDGAQWDIIAYRILTS